MIDLTKKPIETYKIDLAKKYKISLVKKYKINLNKR